MIRARHLAPIALVASATLLLAGCGGDDKPKEAAARTAALGSCEYQAGTSSDAVKVSGDFGKTVTASFDKPLSTASLRRTVVTKGTGAVTKKGDAVNAVVTLISGKDGSVVRALPGGAVVVGDAGSPAWIDSAVSCVPLGSRVVTTVLAKDVIGPAGDGATIKGTDTLVIVVDVSKPLVTAKADDIKPSKVTSLPEVTFGKKGAPTLAKLTGTPPPAYQIQVLRKGDGTKVQTGDTVTVNYQGTSWNSGGIFDDSWAAGRAPASFATNEVVPGFGAALVGQKVGTRLVVTIPPKYAYGEGDIIKTDAGVPSSDELVGQTLVFVIDIQNTKAAG